MLLRLSPLVLTVLLTACHRHYPRYELNIHQSLRTGLFYPLNYGGAGYGGPVSIELWE